MIKKNRFTALTFPPKYPAPVTLSAYVLWCTKPSVDIARLDGAQFSSVVFFKSI